MPNKASRKASTEEPAPLKRNTTPVKYRKEFHARLKAARTVKQMSQPDAARALGLKDREAYAKYESRSLPPHHLIPLMCDVFGVDCEYLLRGKPRQDSKFSSGER